MSVDSPRGRGASRPAGLAPFRIADRTVRPSLNRIETPDGTATLEPKIMQVLLRLADQPGEVVTKQRLFQDVWEGVFVTEDVLTRAIGELRKVLGDASASPRLIETIRKTGYRLMVAVEALPPQPAFERARAEDLGPLPSGPGPIGSAAPPAVGRKTRRRRSWLFILIPAAALLIALLSVRSWESASRPTASSSTRLRPVTTFPGNELDPAVSPDGSRVAFAWNGGAGDSLHLYVKLVDAETLLQLTHDNGSADRVPVWSPDGQRVAFNRMKAGDCRILLVSALGGAERDLAPCGDRDYHHMAWSPDGASLALARRDERSQLRLAILSVDTLARRDVTQPPPGILGDSSPAFSPDGRTLAFARNRTDSVSDVYRVAASGGQASRVTFDDRDIMGVDWGVNGRDLVFSSSRAGLYSLWRVRASGGEPALLAGGGTKLKHPSSARSRGVVAFENWTYEVNLWRVPLKGAARVPQRVTEVADEWNFAPEISPDGSRIAFLSTRSGSEEVWVCGAGGESPQRLTSFGGAKVETPRWSPDGTHLVFSARRRAGAALYVVAASSGVPAPVTDETEDHVAPSWSADGLSLYYASRRSGAWQVWKMRLASRSAVPVTESGGYAARESPDGSFLFFTRVDAPGIWRQPASSGGRGAPVRVVDDLAPEDWANWDVTRSGVYFRTAGGGDRSSVAFLSGEGGGRAAAASLEAPAWPHFSVSRDGAWLVYPRADRHACDIRLIENAF